MSPDSMTKQELANYMCNLITIMNEQEDVGVHKSDRIAKEYNKCFTEFKNHLTEEQVNETGKS